MKNHKYSNFKYLSFIITHNVLRQLYENS